MKPYFFTILSLALLPIGTSLGDRQDHSFDDGVLQRLPRLETQLVTPKDTIAPLAGPIEADSNGRLHAPGGWLGDEAR